MLVLFGQYAKFERNIPILTDYDVQQPTETPQISTFSVRWEEITKTSFHLEAVKAWCAKAHLKSQKAVCYMGYGYEI